MIEKIVFEISGRSLNTFLVIHEGYVNRRDHAETLSAMIQHVHVTDPYLESFDEPGVQVLTVERTRFEVGQLVGFESGTGKIGYGRVVSQDLDANTVTLALTANTIEARGFLKPELEISDSNVFAL